MVRLLAFSLQILVVVFLSSLDAPWKVGVVLAAKEFSRRDFPPGFVFGSGTSAYQVEGAANEDGRTPSIFDTYAHTQSWLGGDGDIACDGYHKYKEDVQLMVDTGLDVYRFSISWPRLIPYGRGPINPKGLKYYNNLINELVSHGIQPHVTLLHVDVPQALEDEYGGFLDKKFVKDFTAYAEVCFREFGDRVLYWTTINEGNIFTLGGYDFGVSPPLRCSFPFGFNCHGGNSTTEPYIVGHSMLLAHASAAKVYKKRYQAKQRGFVGINLFGVNAVPYTNSTEDLIASKRALDFFIGWFMDPLVYGDYPQIMKKNVGARLPAFTEEESSLLKGSFDFIGLNHYFSFHIKDNPSSLSWQLRDFTGDMGVAIVYDLGSNGSTGGVRRKKLHHCAASYFISKVVMVLRQLGFGGIRACVVKKFPLMESGMQALLEYFKQMYGNPPTYIHENGQRTDRNSSLNDTSRVEYLRSFIGSLLDAVRNGSNARGYFTWSFMDVFELLDGYASSFGLYYVDLDDPNLTRYPKFSQRWYSAFLKGENVTSEGIIRAEYTSDFSSKKFQQLGLSSA